MNILFYNNWNKEYVEEFITHCDYQHDPIFHGLRTLFGNKCVDYNKMVHMYTNFPNIKKIYGRGFTLYNRLEDIEVDRSNLDDKIKNGYFDIIIFTIHSSKFKNEDNIPLIKFLKSGGSRVAAVCSNDDPYIDMRIPEECILFKRELIERYNHKNIYPISFAIPSSNIVNSIPHKDKLYSDIVPRFGLGGESTWKFHDENEYYAEYKKSAFAFTVKKGGWDCLRHYEILSNGTIPLFLDIAQCPPRTCTTLPKVELLKALESYNNKTLLEYFNENIECYLEYSKKYITTEYLANYILGIILNV